MMKHFFTCSILIITMIINASAQNDTEAIKILNEFSSIATKAPSVSMKFVLITSDQVENSVDTLTGSIILKGDNYKLELPENMIWYNGTSSWSYLPAEEEVTITKPDRKDNSFQNKPSAIFSMYKEGYKCRLVEQKSGSNIIDLYPEDLKSDLMRVRLTITRQSMHLQSLEYKRKDGITIILNVKEYKLDYKPDPSLFTFPSEKFKDAEIVDMR